MTQANQSAPDIVIIGSGMAGFTTVREIRKLDKQVPITLITREPGYSYSKPMLSTALASNKNAEQLISMNAQSMAEQLAINILGNTEVHEIDSKDQLITTSKGPVSYSKLVLCLGADQIRLPLQGNAIDSTISVNDLEDYAKFRQAIAGKKRIAILGAGLIGCEFANDLAIASYEVDVIDLAPQILGRLLPSEASQVLQDKLGEAGIRWHLGTTVRSIDKTADGIAITLENSEVIVCDVFLSAVGLKPRLELAQKAGIKTGHGIQVDRKLETNIQNIFSIGDCAEVDGLVLPYIMPIMQAARALAPTLLGQETLLTYPAMPVMVKTPALPTIVSPPPNGANGQWAVSSADGGVQALFKSPDGKLLGFALLGPATAQRAALTKELPALI